MVRRTSPNNSGARSGSGQVAPGWFDMAGRRPHNPLVAGPLLGSIEAGGTKWVCAVGSGPDDIVAETRIPTTSPSETLGEVLEFFSRYPAMEAMGVASFGPLELRPTHPKFGFITSTPKPGWSDTDLVGVLEEGFDIPIGIDTDVNGAALAEGTWGAAVGFTSYVYLTVGTGVGGGAVLNGKTVRGLVHPEMGHVSVRRHPDDSFPGLCPYHGDCFEGLASGPAIVARWGDEPRNLAPAFRMSAAEMEAHYVAEGLRNIVFVLAPELIIVGGGASKIEGFLPAVRSRLQESLAHYPGLPEHDDDSFVVAPGLGERSGVAGGFVLATGALTIR